MPRFTKEDTNLLIKFVNRVKISFNGTQRLVCDAVQYFIGLPLSLIYIYTPLSVSIHQQQQNQQNQQNQNEHIYI